jgi:hypothetical protein
MEPIRTQKRKNKGKYLGIHGIERNVGVAMGLI